MSKEIRVAQIGLGRNGKMHAENLKYKVRNADLVSVCSILDEELEFAKNKLDVKNLFKDYDEMISDSSLDAVLISSPTSLHCTHISKALQAGLHVFCEKPLGVNIEDSLKAKSEIERYPEKVFMLGFMRRFDGSYKYAKEKVESGLIGKPFLVRAYGLDSITTADSFLRFLRNGGTGGIFEDMGVHDFDIARWFLNSEAESVYSLGGCYVLKEAEKYGDIDNGVATVKFRNGSIAVVYLGRTCAHGYQVETEIIGTEGSLRVANIPEKNLTTVFDSNGVTRECSQTFQERFESAFVSELQAFIDCILYGKKPEMLANDGFEAIKIANACQKSTNSTIIESILTDLCKKYIKEKS